MVARPRHGARFHFASTELVCWRCALKSARRYKPILQQPKIIVPENTRKHSAQRASQDLLSTEGVAQRVDPMLRPVKKHRANFSKSSRSAQDIVPSQSLASTIRNQKNASSFYLIPNIITRRGSHWSLRSGGRYYTTGALRNAASDVEPKPPVNGTFTLNDFSSAGQNIRKHLQLWQQQMKPPVDQNSPFTTKAIKHPHAAYNILHQGLDDVQTIEQTFEEDEGDKEDKGNEDFSAFAVVNSVAQPGDVVGIGVGGDAVLAVLIRNLTGQQQFYTMIGTCTQRVYNHRPVVAKQMFQPKDLDCILPYLPEQDLPVKMLDSVGTSIIIPREAGAKLVRTMLHFQSSSDQIAQQYAGRLNRIHEILAHPTQTLIADFYEVAMKVLKKESREALTDTMLWAVQAALHQNQYCRFIAHDYIQHPEVRIVSKTDAASLETVRDWIREYQERVVNHSTGVQETSHPQHLRNPIPGFIEKCRALIHESRKTRDVNPSGSLGPSRERIEPAPPDWAVWRSSRSICFDEDESKIIHFLHAWSTRTIIPLSSPGMFSAGSTILRAIGMYENFEFGQLTCNLLLKEIGIIPPWLDRTPYFWILPLPFHQINPLTDELHLQAQKSVVEFQMEDSMKGFRRDWGDLAVFCIDDAGTLEIDDGISFEESDESTSWVHVHVANPSAFLAPKSALGRNAAHRIGSVYLPDGVYRLLPEEITQQCFSLENNRPCITFSARVTLSGEIVDTQISHGILRNVRHLTPEDVLRELGLEQDLEVQPTILTVGGRMPAEPARPKSAPLSSSEGRSLRKLYELAQAVLQRKTREGAIDIEYGSKCVPKVYLGPKGTGRTDYHLLERTAHRFEGDPIISLVPDVGRGVHLRARMISPLMILAGEIGAKWCSERNIPVPYKGNVPLRDRSESREQFRKKYIDPFLAKQERLPDAVVEEYQRILGKAISSVVPIRHGLLATAAYCKVTSPMRRFADLMTHWQIEAAIRHESRTGTSLIGSTDESYLAFSRTEAELLVQNITSGDINIKKSARRSAKHWIHEFLFRAYYYKEAPLPELFNVVAWITTQKGDFIGFMNELLLSFRIQETAATDREGGIRLGDLWEVKIHSIDCYNHVSSVEAVRLVERSDDKPAWKDGMLKRVRG